MTINTNAADEHVEGSAAAFRGEPFSQWTTGHWQLGWSAQKRRQARRELSYAGYFELRSQLATIAAMCAAVRKHGPVAVDVAQAVAFMALNGTHEQLGLSESSAQQPSPSTSADVHRGGVFSAPEALPR